ncbi:hypothetical protein [Psychroserpens sp.]
MKKIYNINKFAIIITLALYLTLVFGLYAQIVLGAIQVISSLLLILFWKKLSKKSKVKLFIYWTLVSVYGICWHSDWNIFSQEIIIVFGIIIIPMSIAGYFYYILKETKTYIL